MLSRSLPASDYNLAMPLQPTFSEHTSPSCLAVQFAAQPPRRILLICTRRIGDVLLVTPLLAALNNAWPQAEIDVLVNADTGDILRHHPAIHQILSAPQTGRWATAQWLWKLWRHYDLAVATLRSDRPTWLAFVAGKYRLGVLENTPHKSWKRHFLHEWVDFSADIHTVNMMLALARQLALSPVSHAPQVYWQDANTAQVDALLTAGFGMSDRDFVVLHPRPKFRYKIWRDAAWGELAQGLQARGLRLVVTGGGDAAEQGDLQQLYAHLPNNTLRLAGQLNFSQLAYLLSRAKLYVGVDTVVTHLAASVGVPTVALYGPSDPVQWGPWPRDYRGATSPWQRKGMLQQQGNVLLVQGEGDCVPCLLEGCNRHVYSLSQCLQQLPSARVLAAIDRFLGNSLAE